MENTDLGDIIKKQREIFNREKPSVPEKENKKGVKRKLTESQTEDSNLLANIKSNNEVGKILDSILSSNGENSNPSSPFFPRLADGNEDNVGVPVKKGFKVFVAGKSPDHARPGDIIPAKTNDLNNSSTKLSRSHILSKEGNKVKKKFNCKICHRNFGQKTRYLKHISSHGTVKKKATSTGYELAANNVTKNVNTSKELSNDTEQQEKNAKSKDPATSANTASHVTCVSKEENGVKVKYYQCGICDKQTSAKADLIKHIRVHTGERPFKCKLCHASFVQITALRGHETRHTGLKAFACDVCGRRFAIKDRLRLHMRIHTGEKPHQCHICDHTFARRSQVSQHIKTHIDSKDTFKCEECDTSFASYTTLKTHVNKHMGIREFQCPACGKKFLRMEGMYKHIRTVHKGNKPYTCNICGKSFKGHLQQHLRLHMGIRPYSCDLCDASFTQNSQLTVHIRIHTGERPYKCQVCGSAFAHSSACKIHMRSHTGERPFSCVICAQSFSQLPHLKKHMKCVHKATKPYMCMICREFFQTQEEIDCHKRLRHNYTKTPEEQAQEVVEDSTLAKMRNRLAVLLYRISSEDRRSKFGFGQQLVDDVLKLSLESSGHVPITDFSLTTLEELRQNVFLLLRWTIPKETMEEYHKNNMTVDEVLDMLTS